VLLCLILRKFFAPSRPRNRRKQILLLGSKTEIEIIQKRKRRKKRATGRRNRLAVVLKRTKVLLVNV
jgi:hypothetical protein